MDGESHLSTKTTRHDRQRVCKQYMYLYFVFFVATRFRLSSSSVNERSLRQNGWQKVFRRQNGLWQSVPAKNWLVTNCTCDKRQATKSPLNKMAGNETVATKHQRRKGVYPCWGIESRRWVSSHPLVLGQCEMVMPTRNCNSWLCPSLPRGKLHFGNLQLFLFEMTSTNMERWAISGDVVLYAMLIGICGLRTGRESWKICWWCHQGSEGGGCGGYKWWGVLAKPVATTFRSLLKCSITGETSILRCMMSDRWPRFLAWSGWLVSPTYWRPHLLHVIR